MTLSVAGTVPSSPYKGLMPYAEEDAPFFFGREAELEIIAANLLAYRLTLLFGASGVGKSSVLRAGVAHHLRQAASRNATPGGPSEYVVVVFNSWRDDPVGWLRGRILESIGDTLRSAAPVVQSSGSLTDSLHSWTTQADTELLIILDQFEEYFLYHPQDEGDGTFAAELPRALNRRDLRANFLISIREDALAKLDRFKGRIPNLFDNYLRIDHLDSVAARAAIEKPVAHFNTINGSPGKRWTLEPQLVEAVLDQVRTGKVVLGSAGIGGVGDVGAGGDEARIETPYLQLVMTRLWREENAAGSQTLRQETLSRLGGADRIVRTHLDEVMKALSASERQAASRAFRYLVTPSGTKVAHTIADLADYAGISPPQLHGVTEKLCSGDVRILRPVAPSPDKPAAPRYEIFHDVLAPAILDWRQRVEAERLTQVARGLQPLHRKWWPLVRQIMFATGVLTSALLMSFIDRPDSPQFELPGWLLAVVLPASLIMLGVAVGQFFGLTEQIRKAVALGFRWPILADVLSDHAGDVGALIAGSGSYASMAPDRRNRIRMLRRVEAGTGMVFAIAPLLGLLAVVALASRRLVAPSAAWMVAAILPAALLATLFIARVLEMNVLRAAARQRRKAAPAGATDDLVHVRTGFDEFEGVTAEGAPSSYRRRVSWVIWLSRAIAALLVVGAILIVVPTLVVLVGGSIFWQIMAPANTQRFEERIRLAEAGRPFKLPLDPSITPIHAGRAYYTVTEAGSPLTEDPRQLPVPRRIEQPWTPDMKVNPFGKDTGVFATLVARAGKGFSPEETRYLKQVASHPGFAEIPLIAGAREMDQLGARVPPNHPFTAFTMPFRSPTRQVANALIAKGAFEIAQGRREQAEHTFREIISVGLLMVDQGNSLIENAQGAVIAEAGLKAIEDFYLLEGNNARVASIRANRQAASITPDDRGRDVDRAEGRAVNIPNTRRGFYQKAQDEQRRRGERWEALQAMSMATCSNAHEMLFGPSGEFETAFASARANLARFPSEHQLLSNMRASVPPDIELNGLFPVAIARVGRLAGWVFRNERLGGCATLLLGALTTS
jgi:hypothetical protein